MYAVELWAICPRVIGQETPSSKASIRGQTLGEQDGNRRFRLLNGPVDRAAGLFHGPVTGTRAEHHARQCMALHWGWTHGFRETAC